MFKSKSKIISLLLLILISLAGVYLMLPRKKIKSESGNHSKITKLPSPKHESMMSIEKTLLKRKSIRSYSNKAINLTQISYLLWAAQGMRNSSYRTAPSAGATYPMEIYLAANNVKGIPSGIYKYKPKEHSLLTILEEDTKNQLYDAALHQNPIKEAAATIIVCTVYERTTAKYGERGTRYVHMEAGHIAQNIYLQATALNLGTVAIGAFEDDEVQKTIKADPSEKPLYLIPFGWK